MLAQRPAGLPCRSGGDDVATDDRDDVGGAEADGVGVGVGVGLLRGGPGIAGQIKAVLSAASAARE